ncbi:MAG: selenium-binding family protein [Planctomycetaceae bacterium]|nr:selenium-binding family protein [Planctomycetaceae bacterium]
MDRRDFLCSTAAGLALAGLGADRGMRPAWAHEGHDHKEGQGRTYATPKDAMKSPREELAYVVGVYVGTETKKPDFLATIDTDPKSKTFGQIIHRLPMPNVGDELHHFGWNACASCHGERARTHLIVPGLRSSRIHIIDTTKPREPRIVKVIEPDEIIKKTKLTAPHTVHCRADGTIMISMLGNENGDGPGGFLLLDEKFNVAGRWEADLKGMNYNYDFWYQPRHDVMVSSEWGSPNTTRPGFKLEDVKAGKYGQHLHFWDWEKRTIAQSIDLGAKGLIPLEVRFHHNPESTQGFVGAALSSVVWAWRHDKAEKKWKADPVIEVESKEVAGWPFPVPGLITDVVLSMDDRWLYFSNWLHGDIRQYDVSDPQKPKLTGQLWLGGVLGKGQKVKGEAVAGGPQMLQMSLDGKRLYVTTSLVSSWDNQFYPDIAKRGSVMLMADCDTDKGGLTLNEKFVVDFGKEPDGPARAHEMRFLRGDSTSDIWM